MALRASTQEYGENHPVIVFGGAAQRFFGAYMAGGILIALGRRLALDRERPSRYIGAGMRGGAVYVAGKVTEAFLGKTVRPYGRLYAF